MEILVERKYKKSTYTIGNLYIDGKFFCNTIEDVDRGLVSSMSVSEIKRLKVYGETAIPAGTYDVVLSMSPKMKRILPEIKNVKGYTGVRIHRGNTAKDSLGCIIVGKNDKIGWVSNSKHYELALVDAMKNKGVIKLTIK